MLVGLMTGFWDNSKGYHAEDMMSFIATGRRGDLSSLLDLLAVIQSAVTPIKHCSSIMSK